MGRENRDMEPGQDDFRQSGTVRWYHVSRGYGFIRPDRGGQDIFVHFSDIQTTGFQALTEGQRVRFTVSRCERGIKATAVIVERGEQ